MAYKLYRKPATTFDQQVKKMVSRGCVIPDHQEAIDSLSVINYYRLSGYSFPFRKRNDKGKITDDFVEGTTWEKIMFFYDLDQELRLLVMHAIGRFEVAIRTRLTYHLSHKYGSFAHTDPANFHGKCNHDELMDAITEETERSNAQFIKHYKATYVGFPRIPLWMLTEIISFGKLSRFYEGLHNEDKRQIASYFGLHHKRMADWLHILTYIRNICAHHGRLWNRELSVRAELSKDPVWLPPITPRNDRVFYVLLILRYLLDQIGGGADWTRLVNDLLTPILGERKWRAAMGVPEQWQTHPIWRC